MASWKPKQPVKTYRGSSEVKKSDKKTTAKASTSRPKAKKILPMQCAQLIDPVK
ncbi:hypothetical protein JCM19238_1526 [Vibrio ponticus]|nr:hypothetical protein JCM19238_1526 [Vibrio ponticus]